MAERTFLMAVVAHRLRGLVQELEVVGNLVDIEIHYYSSL